MKSTNTTGRTAALASLAAGAFLALIATASPAAADPADPAVPPAPAPDVTVQAAGPDAPALPPNGIPHLASPDALPPGSTMDRNVADPDSPNVSYLKDLFHAVQDQQLSGKQALIMGLAQRGMNTPYPDQAPGPNVPITPGDPPVDLPAPPAPAPPLP